MGKDLEIERFRKLLLELAAQRDGEPAPSAEPFEPLNPALANRLLQISLAKPAAQLRWHQRLWAFVSEPFSRRPWAPGLLVSAMAALVIVPTAVSRWLPQFQYARAPVSERKLLSQRSVMAQSATGNTMLGGPDPGVQEQSTLRVKRRDMLTLRVPAVAGEKGPLAIRSFLRRDGVLRTWDAVPDPQADGSFLLVWPVRALPDLAASQELIFVYGRPDALPSLEALRAGKPPTDRRWHLLSLTLFVDD